MTLPHQHPHQHQPHAAHGAAVAPSLLRASAWQRLVVAGVIVAALWAALCAVMA